ncbi:MAG TPA: SBBP repeat-containing protein [Candidatus Binatia bacterium]|nr:SBBP repeat-containing protein [Candidatus Binatia bacterium]
MRFAPQARRPLLSTTALFTGALAGTAVYAQLADPPRAGFASATLRYSTTVGGDDGVGRSFVIDADGNMIIAGHVEYPYDLAIVTAVDDDPGSQGAEGFIVKINAAGDDVVFSTYFGGEGEDRITGVEVDADGNIYVVGFTEAADFPTTEGSLQPLIGHAPPAFGSIFDGFAAKFDPLGELVWSTYLGGGENDEAYGLRVGTDGSVYVVGTSTSFGFPTTDGSYQPDCNEQFDLCSDAFVIRIAPNGGSLVFGSFIGGDSFAEAACSVDVDEEGAIFVAGQYFNAGFPYVDAFQDFHDAGADWWVTKFTPDGSSLEWSSGLGGNGTESVCNTFQIGAALALDANGDVFVGGLTSSTNLTASGTYQPNFGGVTDGYLAKITSSGSFVWGTYFGGEGIEAILDVAVMADGSPVIVGTSGSLSFPATPDALDESDCPSQTVFCAPDAFVAVLSSDGTALQFSTQLGGSDTDEATGVAVGADGTLYVGGTTDTELWPLVDPLPDPLRGLAGPFIAQIGDDAAPIPGDVNGDGNVTASDALAGLSAALVATQCLLCVCDLNGDGAITATDALLILNLAVGVTPPIDPPAC